jgi:hypothetical protein
MKRHLFLLIATAFFTYIKAQTTLDSASFSWLSGSWIMTDDNIVITERWTNAGNNTYTGQGYVISGKDTIVTELMKIEKVGTHWVFIAQVNKNNPVLFTLTPASTAQNLVFENQEHDSPQRVIYKWVNANQIYARTETTVNNLLQADEYNYNRH